MTTTTPAPPVTVEALNAAIQHAISSCTPDATPSDISDTVGPALWAIPIGATVRLSHNLPLGRVEHSEGKVKQERHNDYHDGKPRYLRLVAPYGHIVTRKPDGGFFISSDLNHITVLALPAAAGEVAA